MLKVIGTQCYTFFNYSNPLNEDLDDSSDSVDSPDDDCEEPSNGDGEEPLDMDWEEPSDDDCDNSLDMNWEEPFDADWNDPDNLHSQFSQGLSLQDVGPATPRSAAPTPAERNRQAWQSSQRHFSLPYARVCDEEGNEIQLIRTHPSER